MKNFSNKLSVITIKMCNFAPFFKTNILAKKLRDNFIQNFKTKFFFL